VHVTAPHVGHLFPNSITITIRGIVRFLIELLDAATDPMAGLCAEAQNFDSDLRVWQGIFDHVIKKVDLQKPSFTQPSS
jgi:hypothetical protein